MKEGEKFNNQLLLGIDIGTSSAKVAIFNAYGEVVEKEMGEYPTFYPHDGWVEQDPRDWWNAVCQSIKKIKDRKAIDVNNIVGIGIDGQSWSAIPMDRDGEVLDRTPIWMDTRAADICDYYEKKIGKDKIFNVSGNPFKATYSLPKILWLKENKPEIFKKTYKFLQSNSFIAFELTGNYTQDVSQCYGLHFYNMEKGNYDESLCNEFGLDLHLFPKIYNCDSIVGNVTPTASEISGLPVGIPVVAGGLDAACGALGVGVIQDGQTQEQGGQAGGMSVCLNTYHADDRLILSRHVVPGSWLLQGGTVGGAGVARWFLNTLGKDEKDRAEVNGSNAFHEMDITARETPPGAEGLMFLPYMSGERSPIWNSKAKGVYYGLDFSKSEGHMIRASYEGVAYSLEHNLQIAEDAGVKIGKLYAMGGAANSKFWMQIKADITQKEIKIPAADNATTFGAALLAGVAVGVFKDYQSAIDSIVDVKETFKPNKNNKELYEHGFKKYLELYDSLKNMMK